MSTVENTKTKTFVCVCELQNIKNLHKILQYGVNVYDKLGRGCNILQNAEYNEH